MSNIQRIRLIFFIALLFAAQQTFSQAQFLGELGVRGGISFYNGDANRKALFRHNKPAGGAFIRFNINDYLGVKIDGGFAGIQGSGKNYPKNHLPASTEIDGAGNYAYDFDKRLLSFDVLFCINFFKYDYSQHDKDAKWHTPYVMLGPGVAFMSEWSGNEGRLNLAYGVGYKFKIGARVNAGVEWTMHKLFKDDIDRNGGNNLLDDPYKVGHHGLKNNDYFSQCLLFISVDIFKRRGICH